MVYGKGFYYKIHSPDKSIYFQTLTNALAL